MVRTDPKSQPLTAFFPPSPKTNNANNTNNANSRMEDDITDDQPKQLKRRRDDRSSSSNNNNFGDEDGDDDDVSTQQRNTASNRKQMKIKQFKKVRLTSVRNLITSFEKQQHLGISSSPSLPPLLLSFSSFPPSPFLLLLIHRFV